MRLGALLPRWAAAQPGYELRRRRPQNDGTGEPSLAPSTTAARTTAPAPTTQPRTTQQTTQSPDPTTQPKDDPQPTQPATRNDPTTQDQKTTPNQPTTAVPKTTARATTPSVHTISSVANANTRETTGVGTDIVTRTAEIPTDGPTQTSKAENKSSGGFTGVKGKEIATGVGIAFGVAVGFAVLIAVIIMYRRRRRRREARENQRLDSMSEMNTRDRRFPLDMDDPAYDPVSPPGGGDSGYYREETEHYEVVEPAMPTAPAIAITAPDKNDAPNIATQSASLVPWDSNAKKFEPQSQKQYVAYRPGAANSSSTSQGSYGSSYGSAGGGSNGGYGYPSNGSYGSSGSYPSLNRYDGLNRSTTRGNGYRGVHVEGQTGTFI